MIDDLPEWAKARFKIRLEAVLGYYHAAAAAQKLQGNDFKPSKFIRIYAPSVKMSYGHVYRLLQHYREDGEDGLIPKYGQNKGKGIIESRLKHLINPLIVPGKLVKDIVVSFQAACQAADAPPPCKVTIQKYIRTVRGGTKPLLVLPHHETTTELTARIARLQEENKTLQAELDHLKGM